MQKWDARVLRAETAAAAALMAGCFCTLLAGAAMRSLGRPLVWADEAAILLMCCAGFLGASAALARGRHITVDLPARVLPPRPARVIAGLVQVLMIAGLAGFAVILWRWFDPVGVLRAGSVEAFSRETYNFIYSEPTVTLGIAKVWPWLVLIPFCAGCLLHAAARLVRLGQGAPC